MIKKIKQYFEKRKQLKAQKKELKKMQKYYELLRTGATFIQFIQQDLNKAEDEMNRHQRRRMKKSLRKGELTEELINHYKNEIDRILKKVNNRLKPSKVVDGAKMYEQMKKKESKV